MKIKLEIDDKGLQRGFTNFKAANKIAVKNTLDIAASLTHRNARKEVKQDFTLRNTWTFRNIQFDKVKSNTINKMQSRVGATQGAKYMERQEKGGQRKRSATGNTAIGQAASRYSSSKAKPVIKSNYISRVGKRIVKGKTKKNFKSHKARFVATMAMAYKKKLFIKRADNIYGVLNFSARRGVVTARLEHIYNIVKKPIVLKPEPWLAPSVKKPSRDLFNIYKSQLRKLWKDSRLA